jgi:hypothetical protein
MGEGQKGLINSPSDWHFVITIETSEESLLPFPSTPLRAGSIRAGSMFSTRVELCFDYAQHSINARALNNSDLRGVRWF